MRSCACSSALRFVLLLDHHGASAGRDVPCSYGACPLLSARLVASQHPVLFGRLSAKRQAHPRLRPIRPEEATVVLQGAVEEHLLDAYVVVPATVPRGGITEFSLDDLPPDWLEFPHPPSTRRIGDDWLEEGSSLALSVPSAVLPKERNYLINPAHGDFRVVTIAAPEPLVLDPRLLRHR